MNPTKFLPPRPSHVLERERLINKLGAWEDKKLVIIHAQAGQGKSTLASGYVHARSAPWVWYNMDQEDDNPAVFLSSLGQALLQSCGRRADLPPIPQDRYGMGGARQGIARWIGQVFGGLPRPSLIVFDDYNNISTPRTIPLLLKTLLDSTPPQVRFMLISRTRPEIEIARLRATRAVGEITGDDLRFSDAEVTELFSAVFGMHLGRNEASLINRTAEGWAAGLVLMHEYLSSKLPDDRAASLARGRQTGFHDHVFNYLAQEVFSRLPKEMQDFLLRTSIVDYLPMPLTGLLTGLPASAARGRMSTHHMVEEIRKKNLFVTTVDEDAVVVRYHALFREFLRKKLLAQTEPAAVRKLYSIAADYFKDAGDPVRTVNLFLDSGQFEKAVLQIEACGRDLIGRGRMHTILRWLEALPQEYAQRPWFLFFQAVSCRFSDPRSALHLFERALSGFRSVRGGRSVPGQMLSLGGMIEACFYSGGNFKRMERAAVAAAGLLKRGRKVPPEAKARLLLALGMAYFFIGRLRQGAEALQQALELFRKINDHFYQIYSAIYLAPCAIYLGDFRLAREAVRKGFEAHKSIPDETGGETALHMAQAMTSLCEGSFAEAQECIDKCRSLAHEHDLEAFDLLSLDIGGWLKTAQGDYRNAERLLLECKRKGAAGRNHFFNTSAAHLLAVNYLHQNRLAKAKAEADLAVSAWAGSGSRLFYGVSLAASGAIDVKRGRLARAERKLRKALEIFRQIGAAQKEANVLLALAAMSLKKRKRPDAARAYLNDGFVIGEERGFTYYQLFNAAELAELAHAAISHGICVEYCETLLRECEGKPVVPPLKVYCLGGFRVYRDQVLIRDAQWKSRRAKSLIKLLAAHAGQKISRDAAAEMLWPDAPPHSLRATLNSMLHRARKALEPDAAPGGDDSCILQEGDLLSLNKNTVWTDVGEFRSRMEAADRMKTQNDPGKALEQYEKALSLYQGDFLPDDVSDDWVASARERIRDACLRALECAGELTESLEEKDKAVRYYDKLFLADPCNEKACRWLMSWNLAAGLRSEAVRIYERCSMALKNELDVEPDTQTIRLYRSVIGG